MRELRVDNTGGLDTGTATATVLLALDWQPVRSARRRSPPPHLGVMVVDLTHTVVHLTQLLAGGVATMRAVPGVTMHVNFLTPMTAALTLPRIGAWAIIISVFWRPRLAAVALDSF